MENELAVRIALSMLNEDDREEFRKWLQIHSNLRIIVTGKTGAGKSALLNGIVGRRVFEEGSSPDPRTKTVDQFKDTTKEKITITVWDTPGLQDGTIYEEEYIRDMKRKTEHEGGVDLMLYCISMKEKRSVLHVHESAIQKFARAFDKEIWKHTIFVLTFANSYILQLKHQPPVEPAFKQRIDEWKDKIKAALIKAGIEEDTASSISVYPAGHYTKVSSLPGCEDWLSNLWAHCLHATSFNSKPVLLRLAQERIQDPTPGGATSMVANDPSEVPIVQTAYVQTTLNEYANYRYQDKFRRARTILLTTTIGSAVGGAVGGVCGIIGGPVGTIIGTATGAVVGGAVGLAGGLAMNGLAEALIGLYMRSRSQRAD